jgi:outer membrane protein assembly factor BamB
VSVRRLFPPQELAIGGIAATPVLGTNSIYLASNDTNVYVMDFEGQLVELDEQVNTDGAITATPLLGEDGTLFVVSGDGRLRQFETDGTIRRTTTIGGFLSASPNIGSDGTVYFGSEAGSFAAVCSNGAPKFIRTTTRSQSAPAVMIDPSDPDNIIVVAGSSNGQVRAFDRRGRTRWSLFVSAGATITAAIIIDEATQRVFVADQTGRVFVGDLANGVLDPQFNFRASASISASAALGNDVLYVADELGVLYAVDPSSGNIRWQWSASEDIRLNDGIGDIATSIRSSPALSAPDGDAERTIVGVDIATDSAFCQFETTCTVDDDCPTVNCCSGGVCSRTGTPCNVCVDEVCTETGDACMSNDDCLTCEQMNFCDNGSCALREGDCACDECQQGNSCVRSFLYAIEGGSEPTTLWRVPFDSSIGTASPAIGNDGTVYIGTEAGVLYAVTD